MCDYYHIRKEYRKYTEQEKILNYHQTKIWNEGYEVNVSYCTGTKNCDVCTCCGDESDCDFYPGRSLKASLETQIITSQINNIIQDKNESYYQADHIIYQGKELSQWLEDQKKEALENFILEDSFLHAIIKRIADKLK